MSGADLNLTLPCNSSISISSELRKTRSAARVPMAKLESLSGGSGVHVFLVLWKAARAVQAYAEKSITDLEIGGSDFGVLEALLHKGPLPVNEIGKKILLTSGSITVAVDRLEKR